MLASFDSQYQGLIAIHPDAKEETDLVHTALVTIGQLVQTSPGVNSNGALWKQLTEQRARGESSVSKELVRLYATTRREMKDSLLDNMERDLTEGNQ
jgi:hypothetical protein